MEGEKEWKGNVFVRLFFFFFSYVSLFDTPVFNGFLLGFSPIVGGRRGPII